MSFEVTLVCDGCSTVFSGGSREGMTMELLEAGGRAFERHGDEWVEVERASRRWCPSLHLCDGCEDRSVFFDGQPVPPREGQPR